MLSLERLHIFRVAANSRSFSETARRLGKAQSAISFAISDLEIDLGVSLFDRGGRYPILTTAGEELLSEVDAILSHCDSLVERATALSVSPESRVVLAVEEAFPLKKAASVLRGFAA
jgi:DNA-binding transcriptional LysR family regulator